ncbi:MAG: T9SS type A sorting domain-containing protein [Flavobacteriales bacterium]|nr:T9SS type A sorting domain-containing protein [Flavobacteriales bacterium]
MRGQFTYFNQIAGGVSDTLADVYYNVELIDDTIYTFGGVIDFVDGLRYKLGKFDLEGNLILEKEYQVTYPVFWSSTKASFVKTDDETAFYMTVGIADSITSGLVGKFDKNLDTLWTKRYDNFSPYTLMRRNMDVGDGIVVVGEFNADGTQRGTMLTKVDYDGDIIWDEVLRQGSGNFYRNGSIVEHEGYYLVGGYRDLAGDSPRSGYLTKCSPIDGDREWEYLDQDTGFGTRIGFEVCSTTNGRLLAAVSSQYEQSGSALQFWTKIKLLEIDIIYEEVISTIEYFTEYEMANGYLKKIIATTDGGCLIMGEESAQGFPQLSSFLLKLDSMGNQEWFNYYAYSFGDDKLSRPFDIEQTSDGGYVLAGEYSNWNVGSGQRGWLLKIDACGDVEWQGCEQTSGLWDTSTTLGDPLSIYPNPAENHLSISLPEGMEKAEIQLINMHGQRVVHQVFDNLYETTIALDLAALNSGIYTLVLSTSSSEYYTEKIMIE